MATLQARRLLVFLLLGDLALLAVYIGEFMLGQASWTIHLLFDLDGEATIPAWFTSGQLLVAGWLFAVTFGTDSQPALPRVFLALIAVGFFFLSMDEIVGIHEAITRSLRHVEALPRFRGNHGIWIPVYLGIAGLLGVATVPYWLRLWRLERHGMLLLCTGATLLIVGAVGIEAANYREVPGLVNPASHRIWVAIEEFLEMCGASFTLAAAFEISAALSLRSRIHSPDMPGEAN